MGRGQWGRDTAIAHCSRWFQGRSQAPAHPNLPRFSPSQPIPGQPRWGKHRRVAAAPGGHGTARHGTARHGRCGSQLHGTDGPTARTGQSEPRRGLGVLLPPPRCQHSSWDGAVPAAGGFSPSSPTKRRAPAPGEASRGAERWQRPQRSAARPGAAPGAVQLLQRSVPVRSAAPRDAAPRCGAPCPAAAPPSPPSPPAASGRRHRGLKGVGRARRFPPSRRSSVPGLRAPSRPGAAPAPARRPRPRAALSFPPSTGDLLPPIPPRLPPFSPLRLSPPCPPLPATFISLIPRLRPGLGAESSAGRRGGESTAPHRPARRPAPPGRLQIGRAHV